MKFFVQIIFLFPLIIYGQESSKSYLIKAEQSNDIGLSIKYCDSALVIDELFQEAYYYRAELKTKYGDYHGAESDFTKSIELFPKHVESYFKRSRIRYYYLHNVGGALKDVNVAIKLFPKLGEAYCLRGYIKTVLESNNPATSGNKDFRKARRLGHNCGD